MGKNYVESSLKRFLKRKVKITMGMVVGFLITGSIAIGATAEEYKDKQIIFSNSNQSIISNEDFITNISLNTSKEGNFAVPGIWVQEGAKVELTGKNIGVTITSTVTNQTTGIAAKATNVSAGMIKLGDKDTENVTIKINSKDRVVGLAAVGNGDGKNGEGTKGTALLEINGKNLNVAVESENSWVYGISAQNSTTKSTDGNRATVIINSENTNIKVKGQNYAAGLVAMSQGILKINSGNLTVEESEITSNATESEFAILTRGNSIIEINKNADKNNTIKLTGDIGFDYDKATSGTTVDSDVTLNLANEKSEFNGRIYTSGNPDPGKAIVNGMKLGLYNGGTWNVTGNSFANEITIKDGGKISFGNGEDKTLEIWNREEATDKLAAYDKGIQMQGGAIIEGNGNIVAYDLDLTGNTPETESLTKTVYGNAITVTNKGNILALGKDSSITGNVLIETGAELQNKGTLKMAKGTLTNKGTVNLAGNTSVNLAEGSTLVNEDAGTINVASGATAITGAGKAENRGLINLADTDNSDKKVSKLLDGTATLTNKGTIALQDKTGTMTDEEWNNLLKELSAQGFTNVGMIVDSTGKTIFSGGTTITDSTVGDIVSGDAQDNGAIKVEGNTTITGSTSQEGTETTTDTLKDITVNVEGNLNLAEGSGAGVVMEDITMNVSSGNSVTATGKGHSLSGSVVLNGDGKIAVSGSSDLTLSGAVSQGATTETEKATIKVESDGTLNLVDATVNVAINSDATGQTGAVTSKGETSIKDITAKSLDITGVSEEVNITTIDGNVNIGTITVGDSTDTKGEKTNILVLSADTVLGTPSSTRARLFRAPAGTSTNTIKIGGENGQLALELGENGKNALGNSSGIGIIGTSTDKNNKDLLIKTAGLSGKENTINLGDNKFEKVGVTSDSKIYLLDTILNENAGDSNNTTVTLKYNNELYKGNSILNNINAQAFDVSNFFSSDEAEREVQLDKIYSSNIYSETVKAAYDTVKMNEEAVLSLARKSEVGKWTAEGKALYSKDEYDRKGTVGEYSSEIESTGLMAAFGYGLNETTTAGVAFSGVKQDVDTDGGSADADLFYLGVYGNKVYGNYDFTAGLGYQFGEYEADNTITNVHSSDKYDSKALSGYVQGRYTADLGDGLSLQPRVRLGYTYVEQDDTRDSYFGVSDTEISTFDAEFGLDTFKSVQLEKSKVDVKFGVSYVRTMGDADDEFTGRFYGATASEGFNVLGAELAENVVKFNLGAEVTNENGFFYNGGLTYEFGSDDTDAYGINVGVGYKF